MVLFTSRARAARSAGPTYDDFVILRIGLSVCHNLLSMHDFITMVTVASFPDSLLSRLQVQSWERDGQTTCMTTGGTTFTLPLP